MLSDFMFFHWFQVLSPDYCSLDKMSDNEVDALMVCEKCHGPITKLKRYGNSSKQFCSRQCAQSEQVDKVFMTLLLILLWLFEIHNLLHKIECFVEYF